MSERHEDCPITSICVMHDSAQEWIERDHEALRVHMDVFWVLRRGLWRKCTCRMFDRIIAALYPGKEWPGNG